MKTEIKDEVLSVFLDGEIDHHGAPAIRHFVDIEIMKNSPARLVLDFAGVSFMDSSGVGLIMGRYKLMNKKKGTVEIRGLKPHDRKIIEMSGLKKLVDIK